MLRFPEGNETHNPSSISLTWVLRGKGGPCSGAVSGTKAKIRASNPTSTPTPFCHMK